MAEELERAMRREVVRNVISGEYGVVMEDGKIEVTSYKTKDEDIWPTRSYLGSRVERTEEWENYPSEYHDGVVTSSD